MKNIKFIDDTLARYAEVKTSFNKKPLTIRVRNSLNDCQSNTPKLEISVIEWDTRSSLSGKAYVSDNEMIFNGLIFCIPKKLEYLIPLMYDKVNYSKEEIASKIRLRDNLVAHAYKQLGWGK